MVLNKPPSSNDLEVFSVDFLEEGNFKNKQSVVQHPELIDGRAGL